MSAGQVEVIEAGEQGQLIVADNSSEHNDIQNYLASFNKEIADQPAVVRGGATLTTVAGQAAQAQITHASASDGSPAYFVTQTADGQLQYTPASTGGTYYTTAEGTTYYTTDPNAAEAGPIVLVDGSQLQVSGVNVAGTVGQVGIAH
ncbi:uncharacterized protein LOC114827976 [Galendromus occidentalis]|uniref:Uncharacterized protein LOC114827976 n=1 Tax=Galendromus occidentalis TaxID=34638 RepID=A0AAJ7WH47_9ACAR|nr:uncharacterized protein LOC114827976 [Galendromus occidentalis]